MKKVVLYMCALVCLCACNKKQNILYDGETMYFNGVSLNSSHEKLEKSLADMGFKKEIEDHMDAILDIPAHTQVCYDGKLSLKQMKELCYNYPNVTKIEITGDDGNQYELLTFSVRVSMQYYDTGEVYRIVFLCTEFGGAGDYATEAEPLYKLFPHNRVSKADKGYKTFFDDRGNEIYFTGWGYWELERK